MGSLEDEIWALSDVCKREIVSEDMYGTGAVPVWRE